MLCKPAAGIEDSFLDLASLERKQKRSTLSPRTTKKKLILDVKEHRRPFLSSISLLLTSLEALASLLASASPEPPPSLSEEEEEEDGERCLLFFFSFLSFFFLSFFEEEPSPRPIFAKKKSEFRG